LACSTLSAMTSTRALIDAVMQQTAKFFASSQSDKEAISIKNSPALSWLRHAQKLPRLARADSYRGRKLAERFERYPGFALLAALGKESMACVS
jgi:hypothetical protein